MMRVLKIGVGSQIGAGLSGYVAEIGAAFVCNSIGVAGDHIDSHAGYVQSWLKSLRNDKRMIFKAAAAAQSAADMVLGKAN